MQHQTFGRGTGLRVSEFALGTGNFGTAWGTSTTPEQVKLIFDRFAQAGGTFIDTADSYQNGESESAVGELLAADRDHFTLATKYSSASGAHTGIADTGNSRKNMVRAVEASLRRLRTDRIDLYWVHHPDGITPIEEILRGLDDLLSAGKIVYAGLSNFPAWRISRAEAIADLRGWAPVSGVQVEYSLVERTADRDVLPMAEALGLGVTLWSPLGGGLLTGKYRQSDAGRLTDWQRLVHTESTAQKKAVVDELLAVAAELGAPPAQVSMAWLRHRQAQTATALVPVIGPRTIEQLDDYLASLDVTLSPAQADRLDQASAVALGVPHEVAAASHAALLGGDANRFRPLVVPVG
jgi:aryl-alcohol dehydrogenase-like predicted oxidoreductase